HSVAASDLSEIAPRIFFLTVIVNNENLILPIRTLLFNAGETTGEQIGLILRWNDDRNERVRYDGISNAIPSMTDHFDRALDISAVERLGQSPAGGGRRIWFGGDGRCGRSGDLSPVIENLRQVTDPRRLLREAQ